MTHALLAAISLTPRQRECLAFIERYTGEHGLGPTEDEIRVALGYRAKGSVHRLLAMLEARGRIRRPGPGPWRALTLVREEAGQVAKPAAAPPRHGPRSVRLLPLARWADVSSRDFGRHSGDIHFGSSTWEETSGDIQET